MKRSILWPGRTAPVAAAAAVTVLLAGCGAANESSPAAATDTGASTDGQQAASGGSSLSGTLNGAGSSAQAAAIAAWKAKFEQANPGVTVNYDPIGSGGGREQFAAGGVDFGGTDAYLTGKELAKAKQRCQPGKLIEVPVYISPIAVAYHVEGVDQLRLSPTTLAKIFAGKITNWNDPAIAQENPKADLPDLRITPVHRSDDSGTTENFADYLAQAAPKVWTYEVGGLWPIKGGEAAKGTTGVVQAIQAGNGTIGYADDSQIGDLPAAKIKVGGNYVSLTSEAAAKVIDVSERVSGRGTYDYALKVDRTPAGSDTYPIVLASYQLYCTAYDEAGKAQLAKAWLSYITSKPGQQVAAQAAGSAPLSGHGMDLARKATDAIGTK